MKKTVSISIEEGLLAEWRDYSTGGKDEQDELQAANERLLKKRIEVTNGASFFNPNPKSKWTKK